MQFLAETGRNPAPDYSMRRWLIDQRLIAGRATKVTDDES
jgi:hypothetical protein